MDENESDHFLGSEAWRSRLKRTLLYPGNQSIDNTLPLQVSELCVSSFRHAAPKNESKLGLRIATRLTRNSCLSPSVVMMALIYLKRLHNQGIFFGILETFNLFESQILIYFNTFFILQYFGSVRSTIRLFLYFRKSLFANTRKAEILQHKKYMEIY